MHVYPALHTQSSCDVLATGEVVFAGQLSHVRLSMEDKEPTVHTPHAELPLTFETEPAGHATHAPSKEALYLPGGHVVHATNGLPSSPARQEHELAAA